MKVALCVVGPFPPPRHGVSTINERICDVACSHGVSVERWNTAPSGLGSSAKVRVSRWGRVVAACKGVRLFCAQHRAATVYLSVSGGWGMLYEILFAWITVWSGGKLILHHHSFRYLDFPFTPMKWLTRAAGPQASHVVLCEGMKHALQARYEVKEVLVLTNAAFFEQPAGNNWKPKFEALLIGHLANLSPQKGLFDVLELAEMSRGEGVDLRFEIAGPFETPAIEAEFHKRVKGLDNVKYLGALYEQKKLEFFQRIDVFVFPTRYRNEAEPLVVFEALSQGCPVIAYDRGCISSQVDERCGLLVPPSEVFARLALSRLRQWQDSTTYQASRVAAHEKFQELRKSGLTGLDKLLENLRQTENISEQ